MSTRYWSFSASLSRRVPSVLVPGFDLGLGECECVCHLCPVRHRQVLLHSEPPLQEGQLAVTEGRPPPAGAAQASEQHCG